MDTERQPRSKRANFKQNSWLFAVFGHFIQNMIMVMQNLPSKKDPRFPDDVLSGYQVA